MKNTHFVLYFCVTISACVGETTADSNLGTGPNDISETESFIPTDAPQTANEAMDAGATRASESSAQDGGAQSDPNVPVDAGQPPPSLSVLQCFEDIYDPAVPGTDYDQFAPVVGSHCAGTQHQQIDQVERVVFLGDSVTMGSPPTPSDDFYRNRLTDWLVTRFNLQAPNGLWKGYNPLDGEALLRNSGDFWNCAKWGARTDDLMFDNNQIADCFPAGERNKKTLVILTVGGNDVAHLTQNGFNRTFEENFADTQAFVSRLRDTITWLTQEENLPGGAYVVFGNMFEFTDGTGDVGSCPTSSFAGFENWEDTDLLADLVIWANEQFVSIAVETGTDMVFMLESFCGHGFNHNNAAGRCYRGPQTERWFDLTCIHPNPSGHAALANLFQKVIAGTDANHNQ